MTRLKRGILACILVSALIMLALTTRTARATSSNCGQWSIVPSANASSFYNILYGVAAIGTNNVWAVGTYQNVSNSSLYTLIENWNGTSWSIVPSPNLGSHKNVLYGVAAVTASDIWAVGTTANSSSTLQSYTLIEHWNGTSWKIVPSPKLQTLNNQLNAVAAISANNVWAVGYTTTSNGAESTLIEHWNGTSWSVVASPNPAGSSNMLQGVTAISPTNVWAVGSSFSNTLIEHWNGTSWSIVASPNPGKSSNMLQGVTAISANNIWTDGQYSNGVSLPANTLIEHWNGTSWSVVTSPSTGDGDYLNGIAAVSANNIWVVGWYVSSSTSGYVTLTEQWNGSTWSIDNNPGSSFLNSVAHVPGSSDLWAVGDSPSDSYNSFTEFYC